MVTCQLLLITFNAVAGGSYFRYDKFPSSWTWLSSWSVFNLSAKAMLISLYNDLTFDCQLTGGLCVNFDGVQYPCVSIVSDSECSVDGRVVLEIDKGIDASETIAQPMLVLFGVIVGFRFLEFVVMNYSVEEIFYEYPKQWGEAEMNIGIMALRSYELVTHGISRSIKKDGISPFEPFRQRSLPSRMAALVNSTKQMTEKRPNKNFKGRVGSKIGFERSKSVWKLDLTLAWNNITMVTKVGKKKLTDNLSGFVKTGTVLSFMGPSGAGFIRLFP